MLEQLFSRDVLVWLFPALVTIGAAMIAMAAVVGIWLIASPATFNRLSNVANRWYPPESMSGRLNPAFHWSRFFYRHHRLFGGVLAVGAGYSLFNWALHFDRQAYLRLLDPAIVSNSLDWLIAAAEVLYVILTTAALLFAVVVVARPSALKEIEAWTDRWVEGNVSETLDKSIDLPQGWLSRHPRMSGILILLICIYIFAALLEPLRVLYSMLIR